MQFRTNSNMEHYLAKGKIDPWLVWYPLPDSINEIVYSELLLEHDCVFLKALNDATPANLDNDNEKCWWEYDNHFHPDWRDAEDEIDFLRAAITSAKILAWRLEQAFPDRSFLISISFSETDEQDPPDWYGSSRVSFYQNREGFSQGEGMRNLESFQVNAVMEIEVNPK